MVNHVGHNSRISPRAQFGNQRLGNQRQAGIERHRPIYFGNESTDAATPKKGGKFRGLLKASVLIALGVFGGHHILPSDTPVSSGPAQMSEAQMDELADRVVARLTEQGGLTFGEIEQDGSPKVIERELERTEVVSKDADDGASKLRTPQEMANSNLYKALLFTPNTPLTVEHFVDMLQGNLTVDASEVKVDEGVSGAVTLPAANIYERMLGTHPMGGALSWMNTLSDIESAQQALDALFAVDDATLKAGLSNNGEGYLNPLMYLAQKQELTEVGQYVFKAVRDKMVELGVSLSEGRAAQWTAAHLAAHAGNLEALEMLDDPALGEHRADFTLMTQDYMAEYGTPAMTPKDVAEREVRISSGIPGKAERLDAVVAFFNAR